MKTETQNKELPQIVEQSNYAESHYHSTLIKELRPSIVIFKAKKRLEDTMEKLKVPDNIRNWLQLKNEKLKSVYISESIRTHNYKVKSEIIKKESKAPIFTAKDAFGETAVFKFNTLGGARDGSIEQVNISMTRKNRTLKLQALRLATTILTGAVWTIDEYNGKHPEDFSEQT